MPRPYSIKTPKRGGAFRGRPPGGSRLGCPLTHRPHFPSAQRPRGDRFRPTNGFVDRLSRMSLLAPRASTGQAAACGGHRDPSQTFWLFTTDRPQTSHRQSFLASHAAFGAAGRRTFGPGGRATSFGRVNGVRRGARWRRAVLTAKMLDYNEGTANFAFVEPEREYGPAPFGRHSACTIC